MTTEIIATFENTEDGTKTFVAKVASGYSVALQDIDSGSFVDSIIIYPTVESAIAKAKEIVR